jgi:biotin carboxyl carrier protein
LMNAVEADLDGVVAEVLVGDCDSVEYGQALIRIDPAAHR